MTARKITWVFDVISPFAYLGLHQLPLLPPDVEVQFVPVLFAGLLNHHGQRGPAEIPSKRRFTYRFSLWRAGKMGVEMRLPPTHPFNPLAALRLMIAAGNNHHAIKTVFDAVFLHGRDVSDTQVIAALAADLGIADPAAALSDPAVKKQLHDNTAWAISQGVFGVPTFVIDGEIFWGQDAFEMVLDFLHKPERFQDANMLAVDSLPVGAMRRT
jgi:2-hydroxychromene-2-carboxylate isomerase